jgi:short-subunit dehydrogenase
MTYAPRMEITRDTIVLITGASGGLGRAMARAFHAEGAKLVLTGRDANSLRESADGTGARVVLADLSRPDEVSRCLDEAGVVDVLIANAGLPGTGDILSFAPEQIDRALDVNLRAPMQMARRAAEAMAARGRGHIVFVSSISGKVAMTGSSIYAATKWGMRGFALCLREDLRERGVGVTTIFPGFIREAGMFHNSGVKLPRGAGTRSPDDVARAAVRAVRQNPAEIDVAAFDQRLGARLAGISPRFVASLARALGGGKVAKALAEARSNRR